MAQKKQGAEKAAHLEAYRIQRGEVRNPGGKPKLPEWFKDRNQEALQQLLSCALEGRLRKRRGSADDGEWYWSEVSDELQERALGRVIDRINGPPPKAEEERPEGERNLLVETMMLLASRRTSE